MSISTIQMENLQIDPSQKTPMVDFSMNGRLVLAGSSYSENSREFYNPIINWIGELQTEKVDFDLILDYINTSCAKKLFELLKTLDANTSVSAININWYYQDWDEDNLETGQILNDLLKRAQFKFVAYEKKNNVN